MAFIQSLIEGLSPIPSVADDIRAQAVKKQKNLAILPLSHA